MAIRYNPETDEFACPGFAWEREVCDNHPLFGKSLGFKRVTIWKGKSPRMISFGLKGNLLMCHYTDAYNVPRMTMLLVNPKDIKCVNKTAQQLIRGLIQPDGANWNALFEEE